MELYALSLSAAEVWRIDPKSGARIDILLSGRADGLLSPDGLAIDMQGNLLVSGYHSDNILSYDPKGRFRQVITSEIRRPTTGLIDRDGLLLIGGFGEEGESRGTDGRDPEERCKGPCACKLVRFDPATGEYLGVFAQGGGLNGPDGVHYGPDGHLYVSSFRGDQVLRYHGTTGKFLGVFAEHPLLDGASGLAFAPDGRLFVCSWYMGLVLTFDGTSGAFLGSVGEGAIAWPNRLAFMPDGTMLVASLATSRIISIAPDGEARLLAEVPQPTDIMLVDRSGPVPLPLAMSHSPA